MRRVFVWRGRLRQKELQDERVSDAVHEADKPLARYRDDADLDARLRQREDEEDPMLEYIRRKKNKERGITASKIVCVLTSRIYTAYQLLGSDLQTVHIR